MGNIDYKKIYDFNRTEWKGLTDQPEKYEALLAGHYSDSNHFIYELLQNAEDADATKVVIECYKNKLIFYHNGTPFNEDDVRGVSSMLMGTKSDKNSAQKIGHFGMGFKSVFKYTNIPEIYSDNEAFRIERYLLPVPIEGGWDFEQEKTDISCRLSSGMTKYPFRKEKHLTKFVIPFVKKNSSGEEIMLSSDEVMKKLVELDGRILLFLTTIKELYWVEKSTGRFSYISLAEAEDDSNIVTCRMEGTSLGGKEDISRFLKYTRLFEHKDMKYCNVSIAYRLNARVNNINPMRDQCIWVYFPTKDTTVLPFLVHGSFETAVSREKLMEPSAFNDDLYEELIELICDSLEDLKKRGLITQAFLRQVLLPAFEEERLDGLREAVNDVFLEGAYLPDGTGEYYETEEVSIPVPFAMSDFFDVNIFRDTFDDVSAFVHFNDNNSAGFQDYFLWLKDELEVPIFTISDWAEQLRKFEYKKEIKRNTDEYSSIKEFYAFLADHRESLFQSRRINYLSQISPSETYEVLLRKSVSEAWDILKEAPVILNMQGILVPAFVDDKPAVYLNSSSRYKKVAASSLIDSDIVKEFKLVFEEGFEIAEFDNYQFVKEKVIKKYIEGDSINFESEGEGEQEEEYIEDIQQIIHLMDEGGKKEEIQDMLSEAYIIRAIEDDAVVFSIPSGAYPPVSDEGLDLVTLFDGIVITKNPIDIEFYEEHGITSEQLKKFGIYSSIVHLGERDHEGSPGDPEWHAVGEYCPYIKVDFWHAVKKYIHDYPDLELSKKKSAILLDWALKNYRKFSGQIRRNKKNVHFTEERSNFLRWDICGSPEWIYDNHENLRCSSDISKFELNRDIYGDLVYDKEAFSVLGFAIKEQDETEEAFDVVDSMDRKQQEMLLKQLARRYGYTLEKNSSYDPTYDDTDAFFSMDEVISTAFPEKRVKNLDRLKAHVREQFFCADPTKYQQVLRQIRVSKNTKMTREYVSGMYTNDDGVRICQMCKERADSMESTEIANFGIEMEQLNLCLCPNCASIYRSYRDKNKSLFKDAVSESLCDIYVDIDDAEEGEYELELPDGHSVFFNQIHISEIQEILELIDEYGTPDHVNKPEEEEEEFEEAFESDFEEEEIDEEDDEDEIDFEFEEEELDDEVSDDEDVEDIDIFEEDEDEAENESVARAGEFVSYKKKFADFAIIDCVLQPNKYPLHAVLEGHEIGDVVSFWGKEYEIVGL